MALVWAVESAVLGLWALALSAFSTPFHVFLARCHASIAALTLLAHLLCAARQLDAGHAISEAFVCAVSGLLLMYVMALLDPSPALFALPSVDGLLPLDGCIGLGWFSAAAVSALGMALSHRGRPCKLMFHHHGYHMAIVPPSFLVLWLYNYDGQAAEPVSQAIQFFYEGIRVTHWLYTLTLAGLWGVFIVLQATGEALPSGRFPHALAVVLKFAGRSACVLIPVSAALTARTNGQAILAWVLAGIGAANVADWLWMVDRTFGAAPVEAEDDGPPPPDPAAVMLRWKHQ